MFCTKKYIHSSPKKNALSKADTCTVFLTVYSEKCLSHESINHTKRDCLQETKGLADITVHLGSIIVQTKFPAKKNNKKTVIYYLLHCHLLVA